MKKLSLLDIKFEINEKSERGAIRCAIRVKKDSWMPAQVYSFLHSSLVFNIFTASEYNSL